MATTQLNQSTTAAFSGQRFSAAECQPAMPPAGVGRPANQYHDICGDMDYRADGSRMFDQRESHSPLRHPSPGHYDQDRGTCDPSHTGGINSAPPMSTNGRLCSRDRTNSPAIHVQIQSSTPQRLHYDASNVTNPESIYIADQSSSLPLRQKSPPRQPNHFTLSYVQPTQPLQNSQIVASHHNSSDQNQLQAEIALLNSRLDKIDLHCKEFTKLAQEKTLMEQNLKNLCYLQMIDIKKDGAQGRGEEETRARPYMQGQQRDCSHNGDNQLNDNTRSVSAEMMKQNSIDTYERDMAKFNRIMEDRKASVERLMTLEQAQQEEMDQKQEDELDQTCAFDDSAYLAMLNQNEVVGGAAGPQGFQHQQDDVRYETRSRPYDDRGQGQNQGLLSQPNKIVDNRVQERLDTIHSAQPGLQASPSVPNMDTRLQRQQLSEKPSLKKGSFRENSPANRSLMMCKQVSFQNLAPEPTWKPQYDDRGQSHELDSMSATQNKYGIRQYSPQKSIEQIKDNYQRGENTDSYRRLNTRPSQHQQQHQQHTQESEQGRVPLWQQPPINTDFNYVIRRSYETSGDASNPGYSSHDFGYQSQHQQSPSKGHQHQHPQNENMYERQPSPIKEMNYFDGINAIREEQNQYYQQMVQQECQLADYTNQIVQAKRREIEETMFLDHSCQTSRSHRSAGTVLFATKRGGRNNLVNKKAQEFAYVNNFMQVSKYDLDRADLRVRDACRVKNQRRTQNNKHKRDVLNGEFQKQAFREASSKINRIRDLSVVKESLKAERRENALKHQEILNDFLASEKASRVDERPIQYSTAKQIGGNISANDSTRTPSRSPAPSNRRKLSKSAAKGTAHKDISVRRINF